MIVLGIETSGRSGSIAIVRDQVVLGETELSATGRRHARTLVPEIGSLLEELNLQMSQLDGIAVSIGPGSFTGLRVGIVCAKTLAYALKIPLVAVDTFHAVAENSGVTDCSLFVIDDALRGDVYAGKYHRGKDGIWVCESPPALTSMVEFRNLLPPESMISGPGISKLIEELEGLQLADEVRQCPQAKQIALIGERRLSSQNFDDFWTVEPHYIRRSAAEEKAEQSIQTD